MDSKINEAVIKARKYFKIKDYPGNLFYHIINNRNYIFQYEFVLFKQDLGKKNSGFIDYTDNGFPFICINYTCNIGHQNFTLAHEIGHLFLHKGLSMTDNNTSLKFKHSDSIEHEATEFAAEILYPIEFVNKDINYIYENGLLDDNKDIELADYINELCIKYCISFKFALSRILFNSPYKEQHYVIDKVEKVMSNVGPLSKRYKSQLHIFIENHEFYRPYIGPLFKMKEFIDVLIEKEEIGYESGNSIFNKNKDLEGYDE